MLIKLKVERYPLLDNKPALMRAYKRTTLKDGDGDAWVEPSEFAALLRNLLYFVKAFTVFTAVDQGHDRRVDLKEFIAGQRALGLNLDAEQARQEFARIDRNGGGQVLFDEFCEWVASKGIPVSDDLHPL